MAKNLRKETITVHNPYTFSTYEKLVTIVKCDCGEEIECSHSTNTCYECGVDYNAIGEQLAPSEYWGEETEESWIDIVAGDF